LSVVVFATLVAALILIARGATETTVLKDIIGLLLTPIVGLVGPVLGYYYGALRRSDASGANSQ
jgi:hypothetical protein